mgnify:CR=1 FL=1
MKIASLLPSCTEIACALGLEDEIVGVSHECDFPEEMKLKPVLTKSKIDNYGRSNQINKNVLDIVKKGLSVYDIYEEKLRGLNPDIILTQDQCEVCAVSLKDVEELTKKYICNAKILSLKPLVFEDIFDDVRKIGMVTNRKKQAEKLIKRLYLRVDNIKNKTRDLTYKPKVCVIEWLSPLMIAGNWSPEMIEIAGGVNLFGEKGKHSGKIDFERILDYQPDKIIISPCGFKVYQTVNDIDFLTSKAEWKKLKAVQNNEVYVIDGNAYLNRPSQRIVDSLEILSAIIHPELFSEKKELGFRLDKLINTTNIV